MTSEECASFTSTQRCARMVRIVGFVQTLDQHTQGQKTQEKATQAQRKIALVFFLQGSARATDSCHLCGLVRKKNYERIPEFIILEVALPMLEHFTAEVHCPCTMYIQ